MKLKDEFLFSHMNICVTNIDFIFGQGSFESIRVSDYFLIQYYVNAVIPVKFILEFYRGMCEILKSI